MWSYLALGIVTLFILIERIPGLRRYSPVQSLVFMPPAMTVQHHSNAKLLTQASLPAVSYLHYEPARALQGTLPRRNGILLYLHGNACNVVQCIPEFTTYQDTLNIAQGDVQFHAVAMEYRGYGDDCGSCRVQEQAISQDGIRLLDHLRQTLNVSPYDIIVVGRSIGSGVATQVAASTQIGALVLISPFTRLNDVIRSIAGPLTYLVGERFDTMALLGSIECHLCAIHGISDDLIPSSHSTQIIKEHGERNPMKLSCLAVITGDHNSISVHTMAQQIAAFHRDYA